MDASLWVALLDLLWLILLAFAWFKDKRNHIRIHEAQHKWLDSLSERLRDIEGRMKSVDAWKDAMTGVQTDRNSEMDDIRALVEAHIRKDDAGAKAMALALADRIDALSARMDAVELACGIREKAKTMGGQDG